MSATRDLIAAALRLTALAERNTDDRDEWQHSISEVREMCARAMVQPDMAEVEKRLCIHENVVRMYANGAEFDKAPSATRTALLDYVRGVMAELDALMQTLRDEIGENLRLRELGGALPDENITAMTERLIRERDQFRDAAKMVSAAPQPVGEVPMPEPDIMHTGTDGELYGYWNEYQMIHYGDACKEAGYAAGVAAERERCAVMAWTHYMDTCRAKHFNAGEFYEWCCAAALRGEVK